MADDKKAKDVKQEDKVEEKVEEVPTEEAEKANE